MCLLLSLFQIHCLFSLDPIPWINHSHNDLHNHPPHFTLPPHIRSTQSRHPSNTQDPITRTASALQHYRLQRLFFLLRGTQVFLCPNPAAKSLTFSLQFGGPRHCNDDCVCDWCGTNVKNASYGTPCSGAGGMGNWKSCRENRVVPTTSTSKMKSIILVKINIGE